MDYKMALRFLFFFAKSVLFEKSDNTLPVYKLIYPVDYLGVNWFYVHSFQKTKEIICSKTFVQLDSFLNCIIISVIFHMLNSIQSVR